VETDVLVREQRRLYDIIYSRKLSIEIPDKAVASYGHDKEGV